MQPPLPFWLPCDSASNSCVRAPTFPPQQPPSPFGLERSLRELCSILLASSFSPWAGQLDALQATLVLRSLTSTPDQPSAHSPFTTAAQTKPPPTSPTTDSRATSTTATSWRPNDFASAHSNSGRGRACAPIRYLSAHRALHGKHASPRGPPFRYGNLRFCRAPNHPAGWIYRPRTGRPPCYLLFTTSSSASTLARQRFLDSPPPNPIPNAHALHYNIPVADEGPPPAGACPQPNVPCPHFLARLDTDQRTSFPRLWDRLPLHLRDVTFDLHGSGWSPSVIDELGNVLCEFQDVFSTCKTDFASCSLPLFKTTVLLGSTPVTRHLPPIPDRSYSKKKAEAVLDQYLAAGLTQHSTLP